MKKITILFAGLLIASLSLAQTIKISQVRGDTSGALNLKQELTLRPSRTELEDSLNTRITPAQLSANSESIWDNVYSKGVIDTLEMKLLKDERTISLLKLGADTLFFPIGANSLFSSTTYSLVDNTATIMSYDITTPTRWRGVKWVPSTTGNAVWDGWNGFILLNSSGVRIDSTSNTPWTQTAFGMRTLDFTNQAVLQPGVYYIMQLSNWSGTPTVQPACYTLSGANAVTNYFISSTHKLSATLTGQTVNPASITISTTTNSSVYPGFVPYE